MIGREAPAASETLLRWMKIERGTSQIPLESANNHSEPSLSEEHGGLQTTVNLMESAVRKIRLKGKEMERDGKV